jgi:hypothetical protein
VPCENVAKFLSDGNCVPGVVDEKNPMPTMRELLFASMNLLAGVALDPARNTTAVASAHDKRLCGAGP